MAGKMRGVWGAVLLVVSLLLAAPAFAGMLWQQTAGPDGGYVDVLAVDPTDANTVYVGLQGGGVYKSTDGGGFWTPVNRGLGSLFVRALAIDPGNRQVVYAATSSALYKSVNGGSSWQLNSSMYPRSIVFDRADSRNIYVIDGGYFRKSSDSGATWSSSNAGLLPGLLNALAVDPRNGGTLYAGLDTGVYKSVDGGGSWTVAGSGMEGREVLSVVVDPVSGGTIYAETRKSDVFKSSDGGATWSQVLDAPDFYAQTGLSIDPTRGGTLYSSAEDYGTVRRSADGGATWTKVPISGHNTWVYSVAIAPTDGNIVYAATYRGLYKSTDAGASWNAADKGLTASTSDRVVIDPHNGNNVFTISKNGTFRSTDAGRSWKPFAANLYEPSAIFSFTVDPDNSATVFAGTFWGLYKTTDLGQTWSAEMSGPQGGGVSRYVTSVVVDPADSRVLYEATANGVFKSSDGGVSWTSGNSGLPGLSVYRIYLDPFNNLTLFAIASTNAGYAVYKSTDGAASWSAVGAGIPETQHVSYLSMDRRNPGVLFAATGSGLYKSVDGGASWSTTPATPAAVIVEVDPADGRTVYAFGYGGLFRSTDGGDSWSLFAEGLPPQASVTSLAIDQGGRHTVYAGIASGGIYKTVAPQIAEGAGFSAVLKSDGSVWAWGRNDYGQLGDGTRTDKALPVRVKGLAEVVSITAHSNHALALKKDGTVWGWGESVNGVFGPGTVDGTVYSTPIMIGGITDVTAVATGMRHSLALKRDGTVWSWGDNSLGQLGTGDSADSNPQPAQVTGGTGAIGVAAGNYYGAFLNGDGTVWAAGSNISGELGNGRWDFDRHPVPALVPGLSGVAALSGAENQVLAVTSGGWAYQWGNVTSAQGSSGSYSGGIYASPYRRPEFSGAAAIVADNLHNLALTSSGAVWSWGANLFGQLGLGTADTNTHADAMLIPGFGDVTTVAAGGGASLALKGDGSIWGWGSNRYGQLGAGNNIGGDVANPVPFRIGEFNTYSDSPPLYAIPGAPTDVTAQPGCGKALISFTAPADDGGSPVSLYTVTANPGGLTATGTASGIAIYGLTPGVGYTFTVTATNAAGTGPASAPSAAVIAADFPGAPTAVSAVAGNGQATVSFTPPSYDGYSPIVSYQVVSYPGFVTAGGTGSPITVTGLTNGTSYAFSVVAVNQAGGAGVTSQASNAVTPGEGAGTLPGTVNVWERTAGIGGPISAIAVDRNDSRTLYAVTDTGGGVFKSVNGGDSWQQSGLWGSALAFVEVARSDSRIVYAGGHGNGVSRSTDGGATWSKVYSGWIRPVFAVDPTNAEVAYMVAGDGGNGILKTVNGGVTWSPAGAGVASANVTALAVDTRDAQTVYAGTDNGVFKSSDGGASWNAANGGLTYLNVYRLAIDPADSRVLYAQSSASIYKSVDAGGNWTPLHSFNSSSSFLTIDPTNSQVLYIWTYQGLQKSTDGGVTWQNSGSGVSYQYSVQCLAVDPANGQNLYAGTDTAFFKSQDGGAVWNKSVAGLTSSVIGALAVSPTDSSRVFVGTHGAGLLRSDDAGTTWQRLYNGVNDTTFMSLAIDPQNSATIYAGTYSGGPLKSEDGGLTWNKIDNGFPNTFVGSLVVDPHATQRVYALSNGIYRTDNGGYSWQMNSMAGLPSNNVFALAVDARSAGTLYAGTDNGVYKSTDGGSTWFSITQGLAAGMSVGMLAVDPVLNDTVYFAPYGYGFYKSNNGGQTWSVIDAGIPGLSVRAFALDPTGNGTLYAAFVGTNGVSGVFRSQDAGSTWNSFDSGLGGEKGNVSRLTVAPGNHERVYAGTTQGAGLFRVVSTQASPIAPPSAPTNVTAVAGNGLAIVSFGAPADNGGSPIDLYKVDVMKDGVIVPELCISGTASPITVTGLSNGTSYGVQVRALNAAGSGPASQPVTVTPQAPYETVTLTQTVVGTNGRGIAGAMVQVVGEPSLFAVTDVNGTYVLNVPKGTTFFTVISMPGYRSYYSRDMFFTSPAVLSSRTIFTDAQVASWGGSPDYGVIHGKAVDSADGSAIDNISVLAESLYQPGLQYGVAYAAACGTGTGVCSYTVLNVIPYDAVRVTVSAPGYLPAEFKSPVVPPGGVAQGGVTLKRADDGSSAYDWTPRNIPGRGGAVSAVAYGNGLYVAVAEPGTIFTSTDTNTWIQVASGTSAALYGVAFGNNSFIAVGAGGVMLRSTDGFTWNRVATGTGFPLYSVIYSGDKFVVVGGGGTALHSGDGEYWFQGNTGVTSDLTSVSYGDGSYVAVGESGTVLRSDYGKSWYRVESWTQSTLRGVSYGNGRFVAVGSGAILSSADGGNSWWQSMSSAGSFYGIAYGNGYFLAGGLSVGRAYMSYDGVSWSPVTFTTVSAGAYSFRSLGCINGTFFAGTRGGLNISTTPAATAWRSAALNLQTGNYWGVGYGNGVYCAVGPNGNLSVSPDGINWERVTQPTTASMRNVSYVQGKLFAVGNSGTMLTSLDGHNWDMTTFGTPYSLRGVAYGNGRYVLVGTGGVLRVSDDGVNWMPVSFGMGSFGAVTFANNRFVASYGSGIVTSPDGVSWSYSTVPWTGGGMLYSIAYGNGTFVAVGMKGTILTSVDGNYWSLAHSGTDSILNGVSFGNGAFVAVGEGGTILTSPDGFTWSRVNTGITTNTFNAVTYGAGSFVAVGFNQLILQSGQAGARSYIVDAAAAPGGAIYPSGFSVVAEGGQQAYQIVPAPGYHIDQVYVDNVAIGPVESYVFSDVRQNHVIKVVFMESAYQVTASVLDGKGKIDPAGVTFVPVGGSQEYHMYMEDGYEIKDVFVDGVSVGNADYYLFEQVTAPHNIQVLFQLDPDMATVTQKVVDSAGRPVEGAVVEVLESLSSPAVTGPDGSFVLLIPRYIPFSYRISKPGYRDWYSKTQTYSAPVVLEPRTIYSDAEVTEWGGDPNTAAIRGRVSDFVTGYTIPTATVTAVSTLQPGTLYPVQMSAGCAAGGDCYYTITGIADSDAVVISASAPGYVSGQLQLNPLPAGSLGQGGIKLITEPPAPYQAVLNTRVVNSAGLAVPGAYVQIAYDTVPIAGYTDPGGNFRANVTAGQMLQLKIDVPGYVTTYSRELSIVASQGITMTLYTPAEVAAMGIDTSMGAIIGNLYDKVARQSISGATVSADNGYQPEYFDGSALGGDSTAANGIFVVRSKPGTFVTVQPTLTGYGLNNTQMRCASVPGTVCFGRIALDPISTAVPVGRNVTVVPAGEVSLKFTSVQTSDGSTGTVSATPATPADPPNFKVLGGAAFDIHPDSNVNYSGAPVTVCITYDPSALRFAENSPYLRLMHLNGSTGRWEDITTVVDTTNNKVCGVTTSFSDFTVAEPATSYSITASSTGPGSLTPVGQMVVTPGGGALYTITPNQGYRILEVLVDGASVGAVTSYSFANVSASHTISVRFGSNICTAPAQITVPTGSGTGAVSISWTAVPGASYLMQVSTDGGVTWNDAYSGAGADTALSGLGNGSYLFRVKAMKDGFSDSSWTVSHALTVTLACWAPASIYLPSTSSTGTISVSWSPSASGSTYTLQRSTDGGTTWVNAYGGTSTATTLTLPGGSYLFRVKASKNGYLDSDWTTSTTVTVALACTMPAQINVPTSSTTGSISVSWSSSGTGANYTVQKSTDGGITWVQVYSGTATATSLTGLGNGSYLFRVKAAKTGYVDSDWKTSATLTVTLTCWAPASITVPSTNTTGTVSVSWSSSVSGSTYTLQRSSNGGATWSQVYSGTSTATTMSGLTTGSYLFRVKATKAGYVESDWKTSSTLTVTR
ncbi:RCC1 domain-containing protein [Geomonas azotofigens]|uniref:RCC1 domain-containing protein n=1 Tax=Geomonas azotofigens TaxID=2843196 RepID=UPI001C0FB596|nr:fibronectin type III domain-containing protein [Geomonas azotofigens]MBU5615194.1 fibronectin type III domain-containing protein [Geomonas azotofigens]